MKVRIVFLLFFNLSWLYASVTRADPKEQHIIDSLQHALIITKSDTMRIALRYYIGSKAHNYREGYWDSVIAEAHKHHLPLYECRALIMMGAACNANKEFARSIEYLNRSLLIAGAIGVKADKLPLYMHLATAYYELSDIGRAMDVNYKGLKIAEELGDKKYIASFTSEKGSYYFSLGEVKKALKIHMGCLKLYEDLKDDFNIAGALLDVGTDYNELKDSKNAAAFYFQTKKYASSFGESTYTVEILNSIGVAYEINHLPDSAGWYFDRAYKISQKIDSKRCITSSLALLARHNYIKGNYKTAMEQTTAAISLARSIHFTRQLPALFITLKEIYERERKYKEALRAYELYNTTKDSIANEQTRNKAAEKEFAYAFEKKENENRFLAQQNQIQTLQLKKNKYLIAGMGGTLLLALIISYLLLLQSRLKAQHQRMQLEQKLLRSQMNPHFIYNSLQAIQNYILSHNVRDAIKYLSSFASLTRNVLESSRVEYIPLKNEITLLENYIRLQKLRFGNRFEFKIHIDEEIDTERVTIPPMLAQPFIENAIKHGMHDIDTGGKIEIAFHIKDELLLMKITDNGHGIKLADRSGKDHQSLAMEITRERIALMNKKERRQTTFTISDAYPLHKDRNGVMVNFSLPLHFSA